MRSYEDRLVSAYINGQLSDRDTVQDNTRALLRAHIIDSDWAGAADVISKLDQNPETALKAA